MPLTAAQPVDYSKDYDSYAVRRIPTGVSDFDAIVNGGLPSGSTVLLLGDVGAGAQEYCYTSAAKLAIVRKHPNLKKYFLGSTCDVRFLPEKICYVTFSRSSRDILKEVAASFDPQYYQAIREMTEFKDLSRGYFRHTVVPSSWTHEDTLFGSTQEGLLEALVNHLDGNAHRAMVVVDSLTDLTETGAVDIRDLVATVKGMQRASKEWDGIVYLLLTNGILKPREQRMIVDSVDGVIVFEWRSYLNSSKRQRYMYVEKFMSVLPHLNRDLIARFPVMVTSNMGLTVTNVERIA
jgi:KaiC/GvpD/RAD55 family RecA-like ATPase